MPHKYLSFKHSQSGAVLIVVLLVLMLVSILGVIVYKRSTTDLRLATASQVSELLFQANDAAFAKVEKEDRLKAESTAKNRNGLDTLQGFITRPGDQYIGAEVVFCVRPRGDYLFNLNQITQKNREGDVLVNANKGFCNPSNPNDYVNEGRLMTQMTFVKTQGDEIDCPGCQHAKNDSSNDLESPVSGSESPCTYFTGYAVSLVPSYAANNVKLGDEKSADSSTVAGCLKQSMNQISKCLTDLGVPHSVQVQSYKYEPIGAKCLGGTNSFGVGEI
ncbi:PilX N-terminal domain-containing pilus assembly protein [Moraxella atlantae]|uniref:PilX N-terminal domain-containing pilus assembly protein n=1 Tax=Faucicola atlantae TaxID=34059 RepID=UPI003753D2A3